MDGVRSGFARLQETRGLHLVLAIGGFTGLLLLVAVIGAFAVDEDGVTDLAVGDATQTSLGLDDDGTTGDAGGTTDTTVAGADPGAVSPEGGVAVPTGPAGGGRTATGAGRAGGTGAGGTTGGGTSGAAAADRTGVTANEIKWGLHAPVTFDGQPLNLAEDPLEGVSIYLKVINDAGGVNGRKIVYRVEDDRYTVDGGKGAANALVNDYKAFFVSGTLGVDQIAQVAAEARKRNTPYMAAGGSESLFKDIGMFQVAGSYDTHLIRLAEYLGKESKTQGSVYFGLTKVGVSALDSPYIAPSVNVSFKQALERAGMSLVKTVTVKKPTEQTSYATEIQQLKDAGTEIFVPAQDPITTGRQVAECKGQRCTWKYAASNFAHDSDTALTLQGNDWVGAKVLAGGCYYRSGTADDASKCGSLKQAHEQWVQVNGESDWRKDGSGGTSGYQLTHIWLKALKDAGADLTRERFRAALLAYDGYSDLVSSPITYRGSPNIAHGYDKVVVWEGTATPNSDAGATHTWRQVTPGFVDAF